jgi:predicted unusual protein kinase regulating ubiquinone biosynthesis (AarF/ABC1/UbiB family)
VNDEALRRLETLISVGLRLAGTARSGRVALAQAQAAIEPDWVRPWGEAILAQLDQAARTASEPLAFSDVERVLRDAWGAKPSDELDDIDEQPVAVTPGAQVHRAELDGEPVAVKVLRPGLSASVRQDLTLLEALAAPLSAAFPALDTGAILREVRDRVLEELDLESEATLQRRFHRALRNHPFLSVPAPVTSLCHDQVLVSHWVDGVPLWEAPDPDQAAARLLVFTLGAARWGVAYGDPHADNVRVAADGGLAIVDFGACREMESARLEAAAGVLRALADGDENAFAGHLSTLGWLPADQARAAMELARHTLGELLDRGPVRLDAAAVIAARDRLIERADALSELLPAGRLAPEDLWPARGVGLLAGTIARLGATGEWLSLALAALDRGWDVAG